MSRKVINLDYLKGQEITLLEINEVKRKLKKNMELDDRETNLARSIGLI